MEWLTTSSSDPKKTAATVKGIVVLFVPLASSFFGLEKELADSFVGAVVGFVEAALFALGAGIALFGIARKIKNAKWSA